MEERRPHKPQVIGSIPIPAICLSRDTFMTVDVIIVRRSQAAASIKASCERIAAIGNIDLPQFPSGQFLDQSHFVLAVMEHSAEILRRVVVNLESATAAADGCTPDHPLPPDQRWGPDQIATTSHTPKQPIDPAAAVAVLGLIRGAHHAG